MEWKGWYGWNGKVGWYGWNGMVSIDGMERLV